MADDKQTVWEKPGTEDSDVEHDDRAGKSTPRAKQETGPGGGSDDTPIREDAGESGLGTRTGAVDGPEKGGPGLGQEPYGKPTRGAG